MLISLGSMRTQVDPVRFIQNSSSGRMGWELAKELIARKWKVTLLKGLCSGAVEREILEFKYSNLNIVSTSDVASYGKALQEKFSECDWFLSVAAVLDFEVVPMVEKISRKTTEKLELDLRPTVDFVKRVSICKSSNQKVVAFALETGDWDAVRAKAGIKLQSKYADALVVNRAGEKGEGPDSETNQLELLFAKSPQVVRSSLQSKEQLARFVIQNLEDRFKSSVITSSPICR